MNVIGGPSLDIPGNPVEDSPTGNESSLAEENQSFIRIFAMSPLSSRLNRIEESDVDERGCDCEACAHFSFSARSGIKKAIRVPRLR